MKTVELVLKEKDYYPESMSFAAGFGGPRGNVGFFMIADMDKAKEIVNELLSQGKNIRSVDMGLDGDWNENSSTIWSDGEFEDYIGHDNSIWATPIIIVYYADGSNEAYDCFKKGEDSKGIKTRN